MPNVAPFGRWPSSVTVHEVAAGRLSLSELQSDGGALFWLESRPTEGGRTVCVRYRDGRCSDHSPEGVSIRSRVHEYGGGALCLVPGHHDGAFAYVDQGDQRVWFCDGAGAEPRPLASVPPPGVAWRHGGLSSSSNGEWLLAVREAHSTSEEEPRPHRSVVALELNTSEPSESVLFDGHGFYGTARLDNDIRRAVATTWDHPDMPWDTSRVVVARVTHTPDPSGTSASLKADGEPWELNTGTADSVGQPFWRRDGSVVFVSDRVGWWQPYAHPGADAAEPARALTTREGEFHGPDWNLGQRTIAELPDGTLVARMTEDGRDALVIVSAEGQPADAPPKALDQPCVTISSVVTHGDQVAYIGATPGAPTAVYLINPEQDPRSQPATKPITTTSATDLAPTDIAHAEALHLIGRSGRTIHANFYRPTLTDTTGPADQRPPLIVFCHSGPTTSAQQGFDPAIQFFTTRGFAVVTPNYAGSTGYGRAYREALNGQWGIADAHDCLDTALSLAADSRIDPTRMAIRGSSAGGFTALNALAAGEGFAACVSWYGVTDLMTLAATTHDFEAHYNDRLVGPLPEAAALYAERSPLTHASDMRGAVLLLQGSDDQVVPVAQAHQLHDALVSAGRICELHIFEGEGHGFRRADTLSAAYELELAFYRAHLNL